MNVGLFDVDGKMPNLALMKLSTYHKRLGHEVEIYDSIKHNSYKKIYASSIFTYSDKSKVTKDMITGGTGFDIKKKLPNEIDCLDPDFALYPEFRQSIGFLTRGCIRKCHFCIVPEKEGMLKPYKDIIDVAQGRKEIILLDNNILASEYGLDQLYKIARLGLRVDFNQGLDTRLINNKIAKLLSHINWLKPIRLACDSTTQIEALKRAVSHLRWNNCTPNRYFVYVLIEDIESALEILRHIKALSLDAFAQPFRDVENSEVPRDIRRLARWVNQKALFKKYTWLEYKDRQGKLI